MRIIDNFKEGRQTIGPISGTSARDIFVTSPSDHLVGGRRNVALNVLPNLYGETGSLKVDDVHGALVVSTGYSVHHGVHLSYGVVDEIGHVDPLHLDLSNSDRIQLAFGTNTQVFIISIVITSTDGSFANLANHIPVNYGPFTVDYLRSDFRDHVGVLNWSDISNIVLAISGHYGVDYALTEIRSMP